MVTKFPTTKSQGVPPSKVWYINKLEYYTEVKRNKLLLHTKKQMDLRGYVEYKKPNPKDSLLWSHLYEVQQ